MSKSRSAVFALLATAVFLSTSGTTAAGQALDSVQSAIPGAVQVTLSAPQTTTSWDERDPDKKRFDLPLLYLHREREATPAYQRTLILNISGTVRTTELQLEAVSHHENAATGEPHRQMKNVVTPDRACTADDPCPIRWTFHAAAAPSDLYYLRVNDAAGVTLWENLHRPAFGMLDTWDVPVSAPPGSDQAYTVRVTYAALFPFAKGENDHENRLAPDQVTDFIEAQFVPIIKNTWRTQVEDWGFGQPLHPEWDADRVVDVIMTDLPFALFEGTGTYSRFEVENGRSFPERRIWWFSSNFSFQAYESLEDGCKVLFAHEFFHLMQWNVLLYTGDPGNLWLSWIEAQGRFAPAVQYPELELSQEHLTLNDSSYTFAADRFLTQHLDRSYADLEADGGFKYDAAVYWRFVYEQYGSMEYVRAALEEMPRCVSAGAVNGTKCAMDAAFARVDGPFSSFGDSLIAFSRANYALRLETGRCTNPELAECGGRYYDPAGMYTDPRLGAKLDYDGTELSYDDAITTSYGMDFIEVKLERAVHGQPLSIKVQGEGTAARFNVQVWQLGPGYAKPRPVTPAPESAAQNQDGAHVTVIPQVDTIKANRLALIITRLDPDEAADPIGHYRVTLGPAE